MSLFSDVYIKIDKTEKRAPTDESVKLLREMEATAKENILKSIRLDNNDFKFTLVIEKDVLNSDEIYIMLYSINGNRYRCSTRLSNELRSLQGTIDKLIDCLSNDIAKNLLRPSFETIYKSGIFER